MRPLGANLVLLATLAGLICSVCLVECDSKRNNTRRDTDEQEDDSDEAFEREEAHASKEADIGAVTLPSAIKGSKGSSAGSASSTSAGAAAAAATASASASASASAGNKGTDAKPREKPSEGWMAGMPGGLSDLLKLTDKKGVEGAKGGSFGELFGMPDMLGLRRSEGAKGPKEEPGDKALAGKEKSLSDWLQLILDPLEFTKAVSAHFKLSSEKVIEKLGSGLVLGVEAMLHPLVATLKIVEKVFVPDVCRMKFVCQMGSHLELIRTTVLKLSPSLLEGSLHVKAFSDGIAGKDCAAVFANCEPKLRKPFEALKSDKGDKGDKGDKTSGY